LDDISSIHDWISIRDISSAISWVIKSEVPSEVDIGTSIGFTNLELLANLEDLLLDKSQLYPHSAHNFGNNDVFVAGEESPLFKSGWFPKDSLRSGLEWVLDS
jgi:nucleoside-diphosphate-sugar epimerase